MWYKNRIYVSWIVRGGRGEGKRGGRGEGKRGGRGEGKRGGRGEERGKVTNGPSL